jgi:hypothetical protein
VVDYINKRWPQGWTNAAPNRLIHSGSPQTQEEYLEATSSTWAKVAKGQKGSLASIFDRVMRRKAGEVIPDDADTMENLPVVSNTIAQHHNHRRITQLQQLQLAAKISPDKAYKGSPVKNDNKDRAALESFFHFTHKSDADWTSETPGGSGRSNWLDREKGIERWQGVTVCVDRKYKEYGRVIRFQLPKNKINGKFN